MGLSGNEIIALLCGFVVFLYCFINFYIRGRTWKRRFAEKAKAEGCRVEGRCIASRVKGGNNFSSKGSSRSYPAIYATYEYVVNGKKYTKERMFRMTPGKHGYPETLTFYYDKHRPSKAVTASESSRERQFGTGCFLTILFPACVIKIVMMIMEHLF